MARVDALALAGACVARGELALILGLLLSCTLGGTGLDLFACHADGRKPRFTPSKLLGNIQRIGDRHIVGLFGQQQQLAHLLAELLFELERVPVRDGGVLGGVGFNLRAIQGNRAELEQPELPARLAAPARKSPSICG